MVVLNLKVWPTLVTTPHHPAPSTILVRPRSSTIWTPLSSSPPNRTPQHLTLQPPPPPPRPTDRWSLESTNVGCIGIIQLEVWRKYCKRLFLFLCKIFARRFCTFVLEHSEIFLQYSLDFNSHAWFFKLTFSRLIC